MCFIISYYSYSIRSILAPTLSPERPELHAPLPVPGYPYRLEHTHQEVFDLDLDLNPDF